MFTKISRYYKLPDVITHHSNSQSLNSKSIRLLPAVTGEFQHTLEASDRLDHLAFKYYKQPRKWWRICDANPEWMSPLSLLGQEPIVFERFPLTLIDETSPPPWAALRREVMGILGVVDLLIIEDVELIEEVQTIGTEQVTIMVDEFQWAIVVTYNELNVDVATLTQAMNTAGFETSEPVRIGRVGKPIVIPPNSIR